MFQSLRFKKFVHDTDIEEQDDDLIKLKLNKSKKREGKMFYQPFHWKV